jgi:Holliday junction resolvasome RuvABC endonuclease subunit
MPGLLALDIATVTGWAYTADPNDLDLEPEFGSMRLPKTGPDIGAFLCAYREWLMPLIEQLRPKDVVFESPIMPATSQIIILRKLYGLAGVTEMVCTEHQTACTEAYMQKVRKHFCGHARPGDRKAKGLERRRQIKAAVVQACRDRGWNPTNDDEADALAVLDYARAVLFPETAGEGLPLLREAG